MAGYRVNPEDVCGTLRATMDTQTFDTLTPHIVIRTIESAFSLRLDGTLTVYPSYVNRVYGVRTEDGDHLVAKYYRPGRWSTEAIIDEHRFVLDCTEQELPTVAPLTGIEGQTLHSAAVGGAERDIEVLFALYNRRGGRNFDAEEDGDWERLGALIGRIHTVARTRVATHRLTATPEDSTAGFVNELRQSNFVHPRCREEFFGIVEAALHEISPLFEGQSLHRIHGDCHRGNILDRPGEGLLIIDFDDMMMGPAVQDLWLLLPEYARDSRRELECILKGYEQFLPFQRKTLRLIEPLRLMRMVYFLVWTARQRNDFRFDHSFPEVTTEAFWIKEIEDFRTQRDVIRDELG